MNIGRMMTMAARPQVRFMQRTFNRQTERSDAYERGSKEYGVTCIYCDEYFSNVRKPEFGGYVCKSCKRSAYCG